MNRTANRALPALLLAAALAAPASAQTPAGRAEAQKIRTVVIDPGHGGMESGAKGKAGHLEKDITLAIALKLKALIEKNMSFEVVLTRDKDVDVPVENRSAIANNHKADLFISLHTNGSRQKAAEGSETFFLSTGATPDEETRRLAYLENNSSQIEGHVDKTSEEDVKMILWDMAQTAYIRQSSQLAEMIQAELNTLLGTRNRGIKQAPFKILTGVACPAVLIEAAFISNPDEEKKLASEDFQTSVAEAVYRGLAKYLQLYP
jgi:N-acetylmuramoyl-L-alanine amidase